VNYYLSYKDFINDKNSYANNYRKFTVDDTDTIKDYIIFSSGDLSFFIVITYNGKLFKSRSWHYSNFFLPYFHMSELKFINNDNDLHVDNIYIDRNNNIIIKSLDGEHYECDNKFIIGEKISRDIESDACAYNQDYTLLEIINRNDELVLKSDYIC
jgi:hypothetical protein